MGRGPLRVLNGGADCWWDPFICPAAVEWAAWRHPHYLLANFALLSSWAEAPLTSIHGGSAWIMVLVPGPL